MRIDRFEKESVLVSMKDMLEGGHFNICCVDKCLEITGTTPNQRVYRALSALHCVDWEDMSPGFRRAVCERTISLFASTRLDLTALNMTFNEKAEVLKFQEKKVNIKLLPIPGKGVR